MHPPIRRNELDVPAMTRDKLENFDRHVKSFVLFLRDRLNGARFVYEGPFDVSRHIYDRTVYACSVKIGARSLRDVFPVMIGTKLDEAIRFQEKREDFYSSSPPVGDRPFTTLDMGLGNFIINGSLRQIPTFFTTDSTNTHVFQRTMMRVHSYDEYDRGKQLNWYFKDAKPKYAGKKRILETKVLRKAGDTIVVHNDGRETVDERIAIDDFFPHCPFPVTQTPYMQKILPCFDTDHLSNLVFVTPGHLFKRIFVKHLYCPLREGNNQQIKSKHLFILKSIETGHLLHGLSQKTLFFKEPRSSGKVANAAAETSYREISEDGKIFKEKCIGCYREVQMQVYPLIPYLLDMNVRQHSFKVKQSTLAPFHPSFEGFMCLLGVFETKNVGRTLMSARGTLVSTKGFDAVLRDGKKSSLWDHLEYSERDDYFVVVNEACVRVTRRCFETIDLLRIKKEYVEIECWKRQNFVFVRYKAGLFMKRLGELLVTPRDEMYWARRMFDDVKTKSDLVRKMGFDYVTGYLVDLNPFFNHNAAPKTILGFNALKGAVLATESKYARFFMDSLSAYIDPKVEKYYEYVLPPKKDGISDKFALKVPRVTVAYMSFLGLTQEDCIVRRKDLNVFDCVRFYTLRVKVIAPEPERVMFDPIKGTPDEDDKLIGSVVYHGKDEKDFVLESFSLHVNVKKVFPNVSQIFFKKPPFRVVQHHLSNGVLSVSVEQQHVSGTGDKLSNFHGQKGVMRVWDDVPLLDETVRPDLIVNTYSLFRMTAGQIVEGIVEGNGRDATTVRNTDGNLIPNASAFYAKTFYFPIAYWSNEHMYAPRACIKDKILNQAVKGRSRGGGMRIGNMELFNGMRGNGIASCFEEKFFKHGDCTGFEYLPKSVNLVVEDAKFFKYDISYTEEPSVKRIKKE